jgi:hypothetical protein
MNVARAPWSSASFLVYLGGLTVLAGGATLLVVESGRTGGSGFVLWSGAVLLVFAACAEGLRRTGHAVAAGLFALNTVAAIVVFGGATEDWFGWFPSGDGSLFGGFHASLLFLALLALVAALVALRLYRFPLLAGVAAASGWFFVTDLLSGGGNWTAIVTIAVGIVLLMVAYSLDSGDSRPFAFWPHVVAGLTIGGGFLWFFHDGNFDWILVGIAALLYIALGDRLMRSSWVVLGAWGLLQMTTHFADKWAGVSLGEFFPLSFFIFPFFGYGGYGSGQGHLWAAPVTYGVLGFVFVGIGLAIARRRRNAIPAAELI